MLPRARRSIGRRLFISYLLIVTLAMSILALYCLEAFRAFYYTTATDELISRGRAVREAIAPLLNAGAASDELERRLRRFALPDGVTIRVIHPQGRLLASTLRPDAAQAGLLARPGVREALAGRVVTGLSRAGIPAEERLYAALPVFSRGRITAALRLSFPFAHFLEARDRMRRVILLALLTTLIACAVVSGLLARSIIHPIRRLGAMARRIGAGDLSARVLIPPGDELGQLAETFNEMSRRLAEQEGIRRDFLANVSHELRTPLSNIHVALETVLARATAEPAVRERLLTGAVRETERLTRLVNDLLDLARLESGAVEMRLAPTTCAALLDRAVAAVEARRLAKQLQIVSSVPPELGVVADTERLGQALMNLLDNAIKFSEPGGRIWVRAAAAGEGVVIQIADEGPGIPEAERERVFERFYTASRARSRNTSGTGLGLCISRTIVEAHHGRIGVEADPSGGALFSVWLPHAPSA